MSTRISFTTTGSALPSAPKKLRRARTLRDGVGASRAMQEAREDGLVWGVLAAAIVLASLLYAGALLATNTANAIAEHTRMSGQRQARLADGYYTEPPCIHIRDLPLRKTYRQADIDRLCVNALPIKTTGDRS